MEFLYFTVAGLFLYVAADWILLRIEAQYGKNLPNRSLYFFAIILVMTLTLFEVIQYIAPPELPQEGVVVEETIQAPMIPPSSNPAIEPFQTGPSFSDPAKNK